MDLSPAGRKEEITGKRAGSMHAPGRDREQPFVQIISLDIRKQVLGKVGEETVPIN